MGYQLQINLSRTLLVTSKGASLMTTAAFAVCMKFFHKEPQHLTSATSRKFWEHLHKNCRKNGEGKEGREGPPIIFHTPPSFGFLEIHVCLTSTPSAWTHYVQLPHTLPKMSNSSHVKCGKVWSTPITLLPARTSLSLLLLKCYL